MGTDAGERKMKTPSLYLLVAITLLTLGCAKEETDTLSTTCTTKPISPLHIVDKPISFGPNRISMTKEYILSHYGKKVDTIEIVPKIIILHWTAEMDFEKSFQRLAPEKLLADRADIAAASTLNVSAHFLIDRDGTIYRLMPENWMARHVIGLNYSSIGIENVGGKGDKADDLTLAQRQANIDLVFYLKGKYPSIEYLIGHHEYQEMETTPLWLEKDQGYRTQKADPGERFMSDVRKAVSSLDLKTPFKGKK